MNGTNKLKSGLVALLLAIVAALGGAQLSQLGSAQAGLATTVATSSSVEVGQASVEVLFPRTRSVVDSGTCSSRTITTDANPIYFLAVAASATSTATSTLQNSQGHFQAASTTVTYDSGQWGCGAWIIKGAGTASSSVYISESR